MDAEERAIRQRLKDDFPHYARKCLKIRSKSGEIVPFQFNKAQLYIHDRLEQQKGETSKVRALILKGRQQGCSTYVGGRFYHKTSHSFGIQSFILTHALDATNNLFKMAQRYHDNCPIIVRPQISTNNSKELIFGSLDSGYKIGTAENKAVGRSSTIQLFHGCLSEDSLIVLANGASKSMAEIQEGDLVITSSGAIAPVKHKIYTGVKQTYTLKCWNSGEEVHLTSDHKVLTSYGYKKLSDLTTSDYVAMPRIDANSLINSYNFKLKNLERPQGGGSKHIENFDFPLTEDFGYLLGYYLAEGHIKTNNGYITFTYHKDKSYIEKAIKGTFGLETSIKHNIDIGANRKRTHINGKFLTSAINDICGRVENKHIPSWFFSTNKSFLAGVFRGYLDGDGSKTQSDKIVIPSIHEKISRQMQRICWMLYGSCSISSQKRTRYDVATKDIFLLRISGNTLNNYLDKTNGKRIEKSFTKDGTVYCKVKSISARKIERVWDIEVDHADHNYQTTTGIVSNSEVAFWSNAAEHAKGIMQAVPDMPGTEIILESTANGVGNYFHQLWQSAEAGLSDFIAVFVPWFWQEEYQRSIPDDFELNESEAALKDLYNLTYEQISWRRAKIVDLSVNGQDGEKAFKQEYPNNSTEAFQLTGEDTFITSELVMKCRKAVIEPYGPLVIGVDPARFGDDRTSIIRRQGRVASKLESYTKKDTMEVTGIVHRIIENERPFKVFVDVGGLGAGIVDRLFELGHRDCVVPVNAGSKPLDEKRYSNKRAEMWGLCKEWLLDDPIQIPDSDSLHADLCGVKYKYDSNSRLMIERKEDMKKRGIRSPDESDSLCLTFAYPASALTNDNRKSNEIAAKIMGNYKRIKNSKERLYGSSGR